MQHRDARATSEAGLIRVKAMHKWRWTQVRTWMLAGLELRATWMLVESEKKRHGLRDYEREIRDWCGHQVLDIWIAMVWLSLRLH